MTFTFRCTFPIQAAAALMLLGFLLPVVRAAAQQPEVQIALVGKRVVMVDGHESLVDADKAKPGDLIQYEATYRNAGQAPVKNVAATVPIPLGMSFLSESSKPAGAEASLDGKHFSPMPLMRDVKNAAGVMEKQPVPLTEYRAVRWLLPELPAGENATVSVRVSVLTNNASN